MMIPRRTLLYRGTKDPYTAFLNILHTIYLCGNIYNQPSITIELEQPALSAVQHRRPRLCRIFLGWVVLPVVFAFRCVRCSPSFQFRLFSPLPDVGYATPETPPAACKTVNRAQTWFVVLREGCMWNAKKILLKNEMKKNVKRVCQAPFRPLLNRTFSLNRALLNRDHNCCNQQCHERACEQ